MATAHSGLIQQAVVKLPSCFAGSTCAAGEVIITRCRYEITIALVKYFDGHGGCALEKSRASIHLHNNNFTCAFTI